MSAIDGSRSWTKGDPVSRALLDIAADRALPSDTPVTTGLVELAQRHGLIGILAGQRPDTLIRAIHARELSRSEILEGHLSRVLSGLHEAGIRVAVLKGPAMASSYRNPRHRAFADLDLLLEPGNVSRALELLTELEAKAFVPSKKPKADKREVVVEDSSGIRFNIDIHWDLFSYRQLRGSAEGATELAWAESRQRLDSPWGPHWEIPAVYEIAFLAAHAVLDHRFRLILFRDFVEIAGREVDWNRLERVIARWGLRSTTFLSLWISRAALGAAVPLDFLDASRPRSAPVHYLQWALPRIDLVRFRGGDVHPVNLAMVLLNDSRKGRISLLVRAPLAFPGWRHRVESASTRPERPRTLIVATTDQRRGAEVFTERLRDGLVARGWVVEGVSLRATDSESKADLEVLTTEQGQGSRRFDWRIVKALRRKVKSLEPHLVVANGGATLRYCVAATLGLKCRLIYLGIGEPKFWIRSRWSRIAYRLLLRRTDRVLAVSQQTTKQLLELEPHLRGRIATAYTGIPPSLLAAKRKAGLGGPLHVLMVGSLTGEKDPLTALRVVSNIEGARLRFVGTGPLLSQLESESTRLGMGDRVEFVGSVVDVMPHFEWAHVLVLTSLSEGLPGAIIEAGGAGVPSVALNVGGVSEAILDGESGVIGQSEGDLLEALKRLDSDRDLLATMGENARSYIASKFSLDDVIDRYADMFMESF